jgi:hypothetical protein
MRVLILFHDDPLREQDGCQDDHSADYLYRVHAFFQEIYARQGGEDRLKAQDQRRVSGRGFALTDRLQGETDGDR